MRFISATSASQASRSSPSMSSSNSCASDRFAALDSAARRRPAPQTASAYSLATKPSGRSRARSSRRVEQHAERLVREPALERIADQVILVGARKGLDQQIAGARQQRTPFAGSRAIRAPAPAARARIAARRAICARARRDRSRAETCRLHRTAPSDRWRSSARHRPRPRRSPRIAGFRRRRRRCRPAPASR